MAAGQQTGPRPVPLDEALLDASDVAGLLGIPVSTVYEYTRRGLIPAVRIGKRLKYVRTEIEAAAAQWRTG